MYGTVARLRIKHENLERLRELQDAMMARQVAGFIGTHILVPDTWHDEILMVAMFEDRLSYMKNADDPAMHDDYVKMRALLEDDPEWTDGEWLSFVPS
jgi:quinol monooxygenase YgiN